MERKAQWLDNQILRYLDDQVWFFLGRVSKMIHLHLVGLNRYGWPDQESLVKDQQVKQFLLFYAL